MAAIVEVLLKRIPTVNQRSCQTAHECVESADSDHMKFSSMWLALVVVVAGCVSDDQVANPQTTAAAVATAPPTSSTTQAPSTSTSTTEPASSTSGELSDPTAPDAIDQSAATPRTNKRTQGAPITVTTVGAEVLGKTATRSDVEVVKEWCEVSETGGLLALAEVSNSGDLEGDFILEFEVLDPIGVRVAEGLDVVSDVDAGQSFVARDTITDVIGWEGDARAWTCHVLKVSAPEAVLN